LFLTLFLTLPFFIKADSVGEKEDFFIEPSYDFRNKDSATATLRFKGNQLYFYIDDDWWNKVSAERQTEIKAAFSSLSEVFEGEIYPTLTSTFGSEWKPGIDDDERITVLFHRMKNEVAGYFKNGDEYPRLQNPDSNEREMIYLNTDYITDPLAKSFLAHEFVHLITFNQKEKKYGVQEEIWLDEARADYAPTLLGYDSEYKGSNLQKRVERFLNKPSDSLTEWQSKIYDYGIANVFTQYLTDYYGAEILIDSLRSKESGIESLNEALAENGFEEDFSQIFHDWTIAVLVNDCSLGEKYCYQNENLTDLRIVPSLNFLPFVSKANLKIEDYIKDWSGHWYKLMGGKGSLKVDFDGIDRVDFYISYLLCKKSKECSLRTLTLDGQQKGTITVPDFGNGYDSLTLILFTQEKTTDFGESELAHSFSFEASAIEEDQTIKLLLEQIAFLEAEIARVQAQINAILQKELACQKFEQDLFYGLKNNNQVRCLQEFLKTQGAKVYPEGLVTGNFLALTEAAVIRFQEKYTADILAPLELEKGTGFFGPLTRQIVNKLANW